MAKGTDIEKLREDLLASIIKGMETEGRAWVKEWSFGGIPVNGATGKRYRGRNCLLLWYQMILNGWDDARFVTFAQAKHAGCAVMKGSSSALIEKWLDFPYSKSEGKYLKRPRSKEALEAMRLDDDIVMRYRCVGSWHVFNIAQLSGNLENLVHGGSFVKTMDDIVISDLIASSPCPVMEVPQDRSFYSPSTDEITVPSRGQFASADAFCRTLLHEQVHATGAVGRLAREGVVDWTAGKKVGIETYALEELVAELGSVFAANELGLDLRGTRGEDVFSDEGFDNAVAYLKGWATRAGGAADKVMSQASRASAAVDWLREECWKEQRSWNVFINGTGPNVALSDKEEALGPALKGAREAMRRAESKFISGESDIREVILTQSELDRAIEGSRMESDLRPGLLITPCLPGNRAVSDPTEPFDKGSWLAVRSTDASVDTAAFHLRESALAWLEDDSGAPWPALEELDEKMWQGRMAEGVKHWYRLCFPSDDLGYEIDPDISFSDAVQSVSKGPGFYDEIGFGDSLVRERAFGEISRRLGCGYSEVRTAWDECRLPSPSPKEERETPRMPIFKR